MKKTPYNLYIYFEQLGTLFKEGSTKQENVLKCGLASIELTTNLLGTVIKQKERPHQSNIVSHILKGIETQFNLLKMYNWEPQAKQYCAFQSENIQKLKLLPQDYTDAIDRITSQYFKVTEKIIMGLEDQMNDIRNHFGLSKIDIEPLEKPESKVLSDVITTLALDELEYFNSEDKLFMITHQISECWFNIVINEIMSIQECFEVSDTKFYDIEPHFNTTYEILIYLADHILLLEHMVLSDYHPLRVALRGASGGQSQQAHELFSISQKTYREFLKILNKNDTEIIEILEQPNKFPQWLSIINQFTKIERSLKNFFFQHYILSSNIIGSQSFGSIGYDLVSLVNKFVEPIFKEIDQAKYDLTLKTNFKYGASAGVLIYEKEKKVLKPTQDNLLHDKLINQVINSYFQAISNLDSDTWINLFIKDGYIEDPIGSRPYIGHQELAIFFKGVVRFFSKINMTIENKYQEENHTRVLWKANATTYNNKKITFKGEEVFQINQKGEILSAEVYWDPSIIANQL